MLRTSVPFHVDELRLIEVKIRPTAIEEFIKVLSSPECYLSTLALVSLSQIQDKHFKLLAPMVMGCTTLRQLDLSWSPVTYQTWGPFLAELKTNTQLSHLVLQWN